ncbi:MAG: polyprenyl synthetase family protein [Aquificae bacterium]|nr:polyprenyl synthetase family protein [Aquificota bacterium]
MGFPFFDHPLTLELLRQTERGLREFLDPSVAAVLEAGNYAFDAGGKRLRPLLLLLVARGLGASDGELRERILPLAVGIEYIHTASLLHDDVVDEAETRRGRAAAHRVFGNGVAVLTGDYMYASALYLYSVYGSAEAIAVVSEAVKRMAEGQVLELKRVGELIDEETYFAVVDGKTSALFAAAAAVGALAAGAAELKDLFWDFGLRLGRAFQLVDDALDYAGNPTEVGKPVGQDLREGKATYPLLSVLDGLDPEEVKRALLTGEGADRLVNLVRKLGGVVKTKERARLELEAARRILEKSPLKGEERELLLSLVDFVVERTY